MCIFGTFLVGGGDIRYWLEMTSFWFVMVLLVTSWRVTGTLRKCKKANDESAKKVKPM